MKKKFLTNDIAIDSDHAQPVGENHEITLRTAPIIEHRNRYFPFRNEPESHEGRFAIYYDYTAFNGDEQLIGFIEPENEEKSEDGGVYWMVGPVCGVFYAGPAWTVANLRQDICDVLTDLEWFPKVPHSRWVKSALKYLNKLVRQAEKARTEPFNESSDVAYIPKYH